MIEKECLMAEEESKGSRAVPSETGSRVEQAKEGKGRMTRGSAAETGEHRMGDAVESLETAYRGSAAVEIAYRGSAAVGMPQNYMNEIKANGQAKDHPYMIRIGENVKQMTRADYREFGCDTEVRFTHAGGARKLV